MKKLYKLISILLCLSLQSCILTDHEIIKVDTDHLILYGDKYSDTCILQNLYVYEDEEKTYTIQEEYNGKNDIELGGTVGGPFRFHSQGFSLCFKSERLENNYNDYSYTTKYSIGSHANKVATIFYKVTINLPKTFKKVFAIENSITYYYNSKTFDMPNKLVVFLLYNFNVNKDNLYFYSENGKLYSKKEGLYEDLIYYDDFKDLVEIN